MYCLRDLGNLNHPRSGQVKISDLEKYKLKNASRLFLPFKSSKTLSSTSPGNGQWNQQIEHINNHLKAYTQHNVQFRDAVAAPRLGRLQDAQVSENDEQVDIMITFPILDSAGNPRKKAKAKKVAFGSTIFEDEKEKKVSKKSYNSTLPVSFLCGILIFFYFD